MNNLEKLQEAQRLLKEIGCPEQIMDALWVWEFTVRADMTKLKNWSAWTEGNLVEGESPTRLLQPPK